MRSSSLSSSSAFVLEIVLSYGIMRRFISTRWYKLIQEEREKLSYFRYQKMQDVVVSCQ